MERFTVQKETHQHLLKLKEDNQKMLQQLREQKELLSKELLDVKYSGEAQVSRWAVLVVEECGQSCVRTSPFLFTSDLQMVAWTQRLQAQQQRHDASKEHLNQMQKALSAVRAGVEHLTGRLHHVTLVNRTSTSQQSYKDGGSFCVSLLVYFP